MNDGIIMRTKNKVSDKKIAQKNTCLQTKRQRFLLVLRPKLLARLMYIFSYTDDFRKNSCLFNFLIKLNFFLTTFKITLLG